MSNARELSQIATAIVVDGSKNVSVAEKITVTKDSSISGLTVGKGGGSDTNSTVVGKGALAATNTVGFNTAIGSGTLAANTSGASGSALGFEAATANTTGDNNTAVGTRSLYTNTTGSSNTAIGSNALRLNTTASNNTAVGYQALYSGVTAERNTAVGRGALYASTGSYNTAVGDLALNGNTTGTKNASFSIGSLQNNTTGSNNVALGTDALKSNTTASNNTAVGQEAGFSNTTGTQNVYLGNQAGYTSNANYNTFVGYQTGITATGGFNTFLGYGAGYSMTTGTKNTILGVYNGNQGGLDIRTASNNIVLSDGDGNPRGVFNSSGDFCVGTTSSGGYRLEVIGATGADTCRIKSTNSASAITLSCWNAATSGDNIFARFFTEGTATVRGSIDYNRAGGAVRYNTTSDQRLKENIVDSASALPLINAVKVRAFDWKETGFHVEYGVIAQELEAVAPDAVSIGTDSNDGLMENPWGVDTAVLVPAMIKAIQELNAKVEAQALEIAQLKGN
jgi:trimeric autotransporter adhesin